jgi:hypothetical protein
MLTGVLLATHDVIMSKRRGRLEKQFEGVVEDAGVQS